MVFYLSLHGIIMTQKTGQAKTVTAGGVIGVPKGVARPYEERIADKQRKRSAYLQKIQACKRAISKLEKEEQRFRALSDR